MSYMCACGRSSSCLCELLPVTADVQRELAEALAGRRLRGLNTEAIAAALLPTVRRLIADAEKRAAARALRDAAEESTYWVMTRETVYTRLNEHADSLDPS